MPTNANRNGEIAADQAMVDGVEKFLATFASLPVGSQILAPADIVKVFQDRLTAAKAVLTAEAARTAAVKANRDERTKTAAFVQSFRRMVIGMFSQSPDTLAIFGVKAPRVVKKTVAAKSTAVAKGKATRTARGTKGKRQRLAITGTASTATSGTTPAAKDANSAPTPPAPPATSGTAPAPETTPAKPNA
jgi:hypothetical protein